MSLSSQTSHEGDGQWESKDGRHFLLTADDVFCLRLNADSNHFFLYFFLVLGQFMLFFY